jgi:hypothetical protein
MITVGLLVLFAGFAASAGQTWGRVVGIASAVLSALAKLVGAPCARRTDHWRAGRLKSSGMKT